MDRFTQYAMVAALAAVKDADLTITEEIAPNVGVWIGSGIGGMETFENQYSTLLEKRCPPCKSILHSDDDS